MTPVSTNPTLGGLKIQHRSCGLQARLNHEGRLIPATDLLGTTQRDSPTPLPKDPDTHTRAPTPVEFSFIHTYIHTNIT